MANAASPTRHLVLLGLGSNLGGRAGNLRHALGCLEREHGAMIERVSSWFETEPVGGPPQGMYLNGAAVIVTAESAQDLLGSLHSVEAGLGRRRTVPNAPRPIDLDILLYDDVVMNGPELAIPHACMLERAFVLEPAAEVAPEWVHPVTGRTIEAHWRELRAAVESSRKDFP
jgi:2-amino-4-hydroxy-6-hydroxymethyldihydropteridine diphosphokinase